MEYLQYHRRWIGMASSNRVLNLIINGIPSILVLKRNGVKSSWVLNLIINGIPSILKNLIYSSLQEISFKPYYKWHTFNT